MSDQTESGAIPQTLRTLSQIDHEWESWRVRRAAIDAEAAALRKRHEDAITARFAELDDEQILTDEAIRDWALKNMTYDSGTYQRMHQLAAPSIHEITIWGIDGREGFDHLLRPTVILERDSDIDAVTAELALWATIWLMGRPDLPIDILDSTLSAGGSYSIRWEPAEERAVLCHTHRDEISFGSLHDVLAHVAVYHPYNHGRSGDWSC